MGKPNPVSSAKRSEDNGVILNVLIKNNPAPNEESENEIHFTVETMGDNQISRSVAMYLHISELGNPSPVLSLQFIHRGRKVFPHESSLSLEQTQ